MDKLIKSMQDSYKETKEDICTPFDFTVKEIKLDIPYIICSYEEATKYLDKDLIID